MPALFGMDDTRSDVKDLVSATAALVGNKSASSFNRQEIEAVQTLSGFLSDSLSRIHSQSRTPNTASSISQLPMTSGTTSEPPTSEPIASSITHNQLWSDDFIQKLGNSLAYTVNRHASGVDPQHLLAHFAVQAKMAKNLLPAYVLPQLDRSEHPTGNGIVFLVGERGRLIPYGPTAPFCPPLVPPPQQQSKAPHLSETTQAPPTQPSYSANNFLNHYENSCVTAAGTRVGSTTSIDASHYASQPWPVDEDVKTAPYLTSSSATRLGCNNDSEPTSNSGAAAIDAGHALPSSTTCTQKPHFQSALQHASRRPRTTFEPWQVEKLELIFVRDSYPTKQAIHEMSGDVGLPDSTIRVWFQNRRAKIKREKSDDGAVFGGQFSCDTDELKANDDGS